MQIAWYLLATFGLALASAGLWLMWLKLRREIRPATLLLAPDDPQIPVSHQQVMLPVDVIEWCDGWNSDWARNDSIAFVQQQYVDSRKLGLAPDDAWARIRSGLER